MDIRYKGQVLASWFEHFDSKTMQATVFVDGLTEDGCSDQIEKKIPCNYKVCPTCQGQGRHVNPSIDANGISQEDFENDPDFEEGYHNGRYDVECFQCAGQRVVPWPKLDTDLRIVEEVISQKMAYASLREAETRMGY